MSSRSRSRAKPGPCQAFGCDRHCEPIRQHVNIQMAMFPPDRGSKGLMDNYSALRDKYCPEHAVELLVKS